MARKNRAISAIRNGEIISVLGIALFVGLGARVGSLLACATCAAVGDGASVAVGTSVAVALGTMVGNGVAVPTANAFAAVVVVIDGALLFAVNVSGPPPKPTGADGDAVRCEAGEAAGAEDAGAR